MQRVQWSGERDNMLAALLLLLLLSPGEAEIAGASTGLVNAVVGDKAGYCKQICGEVNGDDKFYDEECYCILGHEPITEKEKADVSRVIAEGELAGMPVSMPVVGLEQGNRDERCLIGMASSLGARAKAAKRAFLAPPRLKGKKDGKEEQEDDESCGFLNGLVTIASGVVRALNSDGQSNDKDKGKDGLDWASDEEASKSRAAAVGAALARERESVAFVPPANGGAWLTTLTLADPQQQSPGLVPVPVLPSASYQASVPLGGYLVPGLPTMPGFPPAQQYYSQQLSPSAAVAVAAPPVPAPAAVAAADALAAASAASAAVEAASTQSLAERLRSRKRLRERAEQRLLAKEAAGDPIVGAPSPGAAKKGFTTTTPRPLAAAAEASPPSSSARYSSGGSAVVVSPVRAGLGGTGTSATYSSLAGGRLTSPTRPSVIVSPMRTPGGSPTSVIVSTGRAAAISPPSSPHSLQTPSAVSGRLSTSPSISSQGHLSPSVSPSSSGHQSGPSSPQAYPLPHSPGGGASPQHQHSPSPASSPQGYHQPPSPRGPHTPSPASSPQGHHQPQSPQGQHSLSPAPSSPSLVSAFSPKGFYQTASSQDQHSPSPAGSPRASLSPQGHQVAIPAGSTQGYQHQVPSPVASPQGYHYQSSSPPKSPPHSFSSPTSTGDYLSTTPEASGPTSLHSFSPPSSTQGFHQPGASPSSSPQHQDYHQRASASPHEGYHQPASPQPASPGTTHVGYHQTGSPGMTNVGYHQPGSPSTTNLGYHQPGSPSTTNVGYHQPGSPSTTNVGYHQPGSPSTTNVGYHQPGSPSTSPHADDKRPSVIVATPPKSAPPRRKSDSHDPVVGAANPMMMEGEPRIEQDFSKLRNAALGFRGTDVPSKPRSRLRSSETLSYLLPQPPPQQQQRMTRPPFTIFSAPVMNSGRLYLLPPQARVASGDSSALAFSTAISAPRMATRFDMSGLTDSLTLGSRGTRDSTTGAAASPAMRMSVNEPVSSTSTHSNSSTISYLSHLAQSAEKGLENAAHAAAGAIQNATYKITHLGSAVEDDYHPVVSPYGDSRLNYTVNRHPQQYDKARGAVQSVFGETASDVLQFAANRGAEVAYELRDAAADGANRGSKSLQDLQEAAKEGIRQVQVAQEAVKAALHAAAGVAQQGTQAAREVQSAAQGTLKAAADQGSHTLQGVAAAAQGAMQSVGTQVVQALETTTKDKIASAAEFGANSAQAAIAQAASAAEGAVAKVHDVFNARAASEQSETSRPSISALGAGGLKQMFYNAGQGYSWTTPTGSGAQPSGAVQGGLSAANAAVDSSGLGSVGRLFAKAGLNLASSSLRGSGRYGDTAPLQQPVNPAAHITFQVHHSPESDALHTPVFIDPA